MNSWAWAFLAAAMTSASVARRCGHRGCCRARTGAAASVSCVTTPILGSQAILRDVRDILAIDEDAPALEVVEAQQHVDERRLAGA